MSLEEQSLNCDTCDQRRGLNSRKYDGDERQAVMMLYSDLKSDLIKLERHISDGRYAPGISFNISRDKSRIIVDFYYIPESATDQKDISKKKRQIMHISLFPNEPGGVHTTIPGEPEEGSTPFQRRLYLTNEHILNCLGNGSKYYTLLTFLRTWTHYFKTEQPITRTTGRLPVVVQNFINNCLDRRLYPMGVEPDRVEKKKQLVDLLEALHKSVLELCEIDARRWRERGDGYQRDETRERERASDRDRGRDRDRDGDRDETRDGESERDRDRDRGRSRSPGRPGRSLGGSTKSVLYLVKIEKLRELNKKLRKNKTKNKNKIEKNNKQIDELKIKIKKEKAKEKLKKQKEKKLEKEKLKKEKAKAKEKLKKLNLKNKKLKKYISLKKLKNKK